LNGIAALLPMPLTMQSGSFHDGATRTRFVRRPDVRHTSEDSRGRLPPQPSTRPSAGHRPSRPPAEVAVRLSLRQRPSAQGCQNGRPTIKNTVWTAAFIIQKSARVRDYLADTILPTDDKNPSARARAQQARARASVPRGLASCGHWFTRTRF
jgi:hypothetical protein